MKRIVAPLLAILLMMTSCTSDVIPSFQSQVVVEGWIENGRPPIVRLSSTMPVSTDFSKQEDLLNNTIDNAIVTITCDGKTYSLHHEKNDDYYPSSIYTSDELTGAVGKSYILNIKTAEGAELQATTSIPSSPTILETGVTSATDAGKYTGYAVIDDDLSQHRYYKMFVRIGNSHKEEYHSSFMGESDNSLFSKPIPSSPYMDIPRARRIAAASIFARERKFLSNCAAQTAWLITIGANMPRCRSCQGIPYSPISIAYPRT